jgi:hypothetical protein
MSDSHSIWRTVETNVRAMTENAPPGHVPVVDVFIDGAAAPVRIGVVTTRRDRTLLMLQSGEEGRDDPDNFYPSDRFVFFHPDRVNRVEIGFEREGRGKTGFSFEQGDE